MLLAGGKEKRAVLVRQNQYTYNKTASELEDLQQRNILFLFLFHLLCNSLKCAGHYDSKGVCEIIQVDKY